MKCEGCGAANPAGASRCEYCDSPLAGAAVAAPPAPAETGPGPRPSQPAPAGGGKLVAFLLLACSGCFVLMGAAAHFASGKHADLAELVQGAPVVPPAAAPADVQDRTGVVCLEGLAPEAPLEGEWIRVPGSDHPWLAIESQERIGTKTHKEALSVSAFRVGGQTVNCAGAEPLGQGKVGEYEEDEKGKKIGTVYRNGIRADAPVTVVGTFSKAAGTPTLTAQLVSDAPTRAALQTRLADMSAMEGVLSWVCTGFGVVAFLGFLFLLTRKGS